MAVDLIKGLTGDTAGVVRLSHCAQQLLPELLKLISDQDKIQQSAVTSLVNLCQVLFWREHNLHVMHVQQLYVCCLFCCFPYRIQL